MRKIACVALATVLVVMMVAPVTAVNYVYCVVTRSVDVVEAVPEHPVFNFETSTQGWVPGPYGVGGAVTATTRDATRAKCGSWSLKCTLTESKKGNDGFVGVDMVNFSPPGIAVPVDLRNKTISVWLWLPVDVQSTGVGVQLFFKDSNWKWADSKWHNVSCGDVGGWNQLTINTANAGDWGYVEAGFDLSQVRVVGVKIGAGSWCGTFSGELWIDAYDW